MKTDDHPFYFEKSGADEKRASLYNLDVKAKYLAARAANSFDPPFRCGQTSPLNRWSCSLDVGHRGGHVACMETTGEILARWVDPEYQYLITEESDLFEEVWP